MKHQIIKVESYVEHKISLEEDNNKQLENRTDLVISGIAATEGALFYIVKQISYQYFDFVNNKWVVLPNPQQPKIEGVSFNDEEEGVNSDE